MAAYQRQVAAANRAQKAADAQQLAAAFQAILNVHRHEFPIATKPNAVRRTVPDESELYARFEKQALEGIGLFKRQQRKEARNVAAGQARAEHARLSAEADAEQQRHQQELDTWWEQLLANNPETVLTSLERAFEDNEAPAAAVGLDGDELSLVVLAPAPDVVPERMPELTAAGNLSLRKLAKGKRTSFYVLLVIGHVLVTVREALAIAPSVNAVRTALIRMGTPAYGHTKVECLAAARFTRAALEGVQWSTADAATIFNDTSTDRVLKQTGSTGELKPLDLSNEPQLRALVEAVDPSELTDESDA